MHNSKNTDQQTIIHAEHFMKYDILIYLFLYTHMYTHISWVLANININDDIRSISHGFWTITGPGSRRQRPFLDQAPLTHQQLAGPLFAA